MHVRIIVNPIAGAGKGLVRAEELRRELASRGATAEILVTQRKGDAQREAARPGADCVVSVGGDGSANEVANGLRGSAALMAILPLGTANVVARELRLPSKPRELAALIGQRSVRAVDAGIILGRRFLLGAGAGLDAAVIDEVHARRGAHLSLAAYVRPVARTVWHYAYPPVRVLTDGRLVCEDAVYVVVGNCRFSAAVFPVTPEARLDDGLLDVCVFRDLTISKIIRLAAASWRKGFAHRKDLYYTQARAIRLEPASDAPVPFQVDGDPADGLPASIAVEPAALRIIAPPMS